MKLPEADIAMTPKYTESRPRGRLQWPRGLRHEMSSLARTLGEWVRIPLKARMSICVCSGFVLGSGLVTG
jgi:hypothetical protein